MPGDAVREETSAGGVVFRWFDDGPRYLLILDRYGNWGFPKGHVEREESSLDAARREIGEETGLRRLALRGSLPRISWQFHDAGVVVRKQCDYFLFESGAGAVRPQSEEGITACDWYRLESAKDTVTFQNVRDVLLAAARLVDRLDNVGATAEHG